ncbi:MAG: hypothetical protein AB1744_16250, partial [Candidatus Zixiibacteriota bacterium]
MKELQALNDRLEEGGYIEKLQDLESDLSKLQEALELREDALNQLDRRTYRLSRSLRDELEALQLVLEEDLAPQVDEHRAYEETIRAYLKATLAAAIGEDIKQHTLKVIVDDETGTVEVITTPEAEAPMAIVIPPDVRPPAPPAPYKPPHSIRSRLKPHKGGSAVTSQFVDSIEVTSRTQPIYITNPIGHLDITGWDQKKVLVMSELEVSAESRDKVTAFADQFVLHVCPKSDGIGVEMEMPRLKDPGTTVQQSVLTIRAPHGNPLVCTNSFGDVRISEIKSDVTLNASNSRVNMESVTGRVQLVNNMGEVELRRIQGPIRVTNAHAPIQV